MILSDIGMIVKREWNKTFELRSDMNLIMDEFVIMPNHFHGIIVIGENIYNIGDFDGTQCRATMHCGSTGNDQTKNKFGPQSKNLASIIRGFKSAVTRDARQNNPDFQWQPKYYDHIIRNNDSLQKIRSYISENPSKWTEDDYYTS